MKYETLKAVVFIAIGIFGGYSVRPLPQTKAHAPIVVSTGNAITRKEFADTLKKTGPDGLTRLLGSPDKLGPPGHPTLGPCWIYLNRTYLADPSKRDASAYVFRYENGAIESVVFHE